MILLHKKENIIIDLFDFKENFFEKEGEDPKKGTNDFILEDLQEDSKPEEEKEQDNLLGQGSEALEGSVAEARLRIKQEEQQAKEQIQQILADARQEAEAILQQAREEGISIKEEAHKQGMEKGLLEGEKQAYEEYTENLQQKTVAFMMQLKEMAEAFQEERVRLVDDSIEDLKDISIAVAEKVIQVSLKSSGEVIRRMILTATEKLRYKQWVKIYISQIDSSLFMEANTDLVKSLEHLSDHIKIVAMESAAPGTCIIELPDQIIDVSANEQLENIRGILKVARGHGGENHV